MKITCFLFFLCASVFADGVYNPPAALTGTEADTLATVLARGNTAGRDLDMGGNSVTNIATNSLTFANGVSIKSAATGAIIMATNKLQAIQNWDGTVAIDLVNKIAVADVIATSTTNEPMKIVSSSPDEMLFGFNGDPDGKVKLIHEVGVANYFEGIGAEPMVYRVVPNAYSASWDDDDDAPAKNDVYDKIESMGGGGSGDLTAITGGNGIVITSGTGPIPDVAVSNAVVVGALNANATLACAFAGTPNQMIAQASANTNINFLTEYDPNNLFDLVNDKYTTPSAGDYEVAANTSVSNAVAAQIYRLSIFVNSAQYTLCGVQAAGAFTVMPLPHPSVVLTNLASGDVIETKIFASQIPCGITSYTAPATYMTVKRIR